MTAEPDPEQGAAEAEALARYRAAARRRAAEPDPPRTRRFGGRRSPNGMTGPGPHPRDPQPVGDVLRWLSDGHGWTNELAVWSLTNRWPELVGPQVAARVAVVEFDPKPVAAQPQADRNPQSDAPTQQGLFAQESAQRERERPGAGRTGGTLTLRADSNSWQQHMVWGLALLQQRLDAELGPGVVGRIVVLGPPTKRAAGRLRARR